jgi:RNA polymerase sigma-70 factor (ECF subfamily)
MRRLGRSEGEDAAADVFAVAWRRLDEVPNGDAARAWLFGVAYRVVGNHYRRRARQERLTSRLEAAFERGTVSTETPAGFEDPAGVVAALGSLRPPDRELLSMAVWDGLSRFEIAQVLGVTENAVDQRMFRARKRLRDRMNLVPAIDGREA